MSPLVAGFIGHKPCFLQVSGWDMDQSNYKMVSVILRASDKFGFNSLFDAVKKTWDVLTAPRWRRSSLGCLGFVSGGRMKKWRRSRHLGFCRAIMSSIFIDSRWFKPRTFLMWCHRFVQTENLTRLCPPPSLSVVAPAPVTSPWVRSSWRSDTARRGTSSSWWFTAAGTS